MTEANASEHLMSQMLQLLEGFDFEATTDVLAALIANAVASHASSQSEAHVQAATLFEAIHYAIGKRFEEASEEEFSDG